MGRYWMAGALSYGGAAAPRLHLITGGVWSRTLAFDVEPAPVEAIAELVGASLDVAVRIKARPEGRLVRLGVVGRRGPDGIESDEIAVLLELVAHAPPRLLWSGRGDQARLTADGCIDERLVDFQMLFGRRLEMFVTGRSRPRVAGAGARCAAGPGLQESLAPNPVALKAGRVIGPAAR
jgi:hypothetical protein